MLKEAGADVVPVLAEMLADRDLSVWFVGNSARLAASCPDSEQFREALRDRRDDPAFGDDPGARLAVFDYFAKNGDTMDLAWMEQAAHSLDESRRPYADKPITELRRRVAR